MDLIFKILLGVLLLLCIGVIFYFLDRKQQQEFRIHAELQMRSESLDINIAAPVIAEQEIIIESSIEKVWDTLTSIENWTSWQSQITKVEIDSAPIKYTTFSWIACGLKYESQIHMCDEKQHFGWIGTTWGAQAIHNWYFESIDTNKTKVVVKESLEGLLPSMFTSFFISTLNNGMKANLDELRKVCEGN